MPVNFEIDFIQPLLLDLQNGKFSDVDDYAKAVSKYYQQTIAKGAPIGIPPTLPSPAAQGAPVPVSAGPGDGYTPPLSTVSYSRMERIVVGYYKAKDISINEATLDYYKKALTRLVQDAKTQRDKIQALVPLIKKLTQQAAQLPQNIKQIVKGIDVVFTSYKEDLTTIVESSDLVNEQEQQQLQNTLQSSYSEELNLYNKLKQGGFENLQDIINTSVTLKRYVKNQEQKGSNTQDIFKTRFKGLLSNMIADFSNATQPEGFADVLTRFKENKSNLTADKKQVIQKTEKAIESVKLIKYFVEPEIAKLKKELEISKKNVKARFDRKIEEQKKVISKKVSEIAKKKAGVKEKSEKQKLFEKYVKDVKRLKEENEKKVKDYATKAKAVSSLVQDSVKLVASVELTRKDAIKQVDVLKKKVENIQPTNLENNDNNRELKSYLNKQGLSDYKQALEPITQNTTTNFINIRNVLQDTDDSYGKLINRLNSIQEDLEKLEDGFNELRGERKQTKRRVRKVKVKTPQSLLSVLKLIKKLKQSIDVFVGRCESWVKEQIKKKQKDIDALNERIQIAVINSLPKSIGAESVATQKQAAEEAKRLVEVYKAKIDTVTKKTRAAVLAGKSAIKLGQNASTKDLTIGSNEQPLKAFSKAIFDYQTVGVQATSSNYKYWLSWKQDFDKNINKFKTLSQLTVIAKALLSELAPPKSLSFTQRLTQDLQKASNTQVGLNRTDYDKVTNIVKRFIEAPANDPKSLIQVVKEIDNTIKKQSLKKFIGSANVVTVLISIEREYLQKTRKRVKQLAAASEKASKLDSDSKSLRESNKKLQELSKALDGQGSLLVELISLIAKYAKQLELFLVKEVKDQLKPIEDKLKTEKKRIEEQFQERLKNQVKKKVKNDLTPQSIMYNVATNLFWAGSTWTNSVGTTFQVGTIGPFRPLLIDGKVSGIEASVRELAANLQLQLLQVSGLVIPNPSTGITPFPFVGYK